jgi:hypothetical protein
MPGGNSPLPADLPDAARERMVQDLKRVFDATMAITPEYTRIGQLFSYYLYCRSVGITIMTGPSTVPPPGIDPPPTEAELHAIGNTLEDIGRASPILRSMYARAKKRG